MQTIFWDNTRNFIKNMNFSSKCTHTRWTKSRQISPAAVFLFELSLGGFHCSTNHLADKRPTPTNDQNDKAREHPTKKQKRWSITQKGQPRRQWTKKLKKRAAAVWDKDATTQDETKSNKWKIRQPHMNRKGNPKESEKRQDSSERHS